MNKSVENIELAPGLEISRVLTGLWQIADLERDGQTLDPSETSKAMQPYVDQGFSTFDMADHYGSAEIIAGTFKKRNPDQSVQLLTKWVPKPGKLTKDDVREAVQTAMDRLQVQKIDLLQFHAWNYADPSYLDQMFWLQELKNEGLIGHLGVTNFDAAHLRVVKSSGIDIVSNQICYSLLDRRASGEMTTVCAELGIKILAFGTIAGGFLSEKWLGKAEPDWTNIDTWSLMKYKRFIDSSGGWEAYQQVLKTVKKIADKYDVSIANVASKYMLQRPQVAGVILGARLGRSEHVAENLKLFQFELSDEDLKSIKAATGELTPIHGDCGDEYRKPPFLTASGDLSHHLDSLPKPFGTTQGTNGIKVLSGTTWESEFGYCRAIRKGNRILISGTTASHGDKLIGGTDPAAQAHFCIDKIEGAIQSLGGKIGNVIRTRIFVKNVSDWEPIAKAHGSRFRDIQPANTLVQADLIGEEFLVEIEAEAVLSEDSN
ncbi:MAG: aldo/keto reductase [Cyclobacteriaceae bacterium]